MGQINPSPTFPVLLDTKSEAAHAFRVMGIPTTYLMGKRGFIVDWMSNLPILKGCGQICRCWNRSSRRRSQ